MSLWVCTKHGLYGGDVFCPECGSTGRIAELASDCDDGAPPDSKVSVEQYAQGLLGEESSEIGQALGKAARFGIDTPGPKAAPYFGGTARQMLEHECGDMLAAIEWATLAGLISAGAVEGQRQRKLHKLLNPDSKDNLGRRLAPAIPAGSWIRSNGE